MEYISQRGSFDDVPLARMVADFALLYPAWQSQGWQLQAADFTADIDHESHG
jgi:hypothetical protein